MHEIPQLANNNKKLQEVGNFKNVIKKAKEACKGSNVAEEKHFADVGKTSKTKINIYLTQQNWQELRMTENLTIMDIEDLPTPSKSAKQIESEKQKRLSTSKNKKRK